jgi:hypothetical protein
LKIATRLTHPQVPSECVENVRAGLCARLEARYTGHWHPHEPLVGHAAVSLWSCCDCSLALSLLHSMRTATSHHSLCAFKPSFSHLHPSALGKCGVSCLWCRHTLMVSRKGAPFAAGALLRHTNCAPLQFHVSVATCAVRKCFSRHPVHVRSTRPGEWPKSQPPLSPPTHHHHCCRTNAEWCAVWQRARVIVVDTCLRRMNVEQYFYRLRFAPSTIHPPVEPPYAACVL